MAMYRFGDGEIALIDGNPIGRNTQAAETDRWTSPGGMTLLGRDLKTVLETQEACFHFGIPCPCCNPSGNLDLKRRVTKAPLFPANLWINANYPHFIAFLRGLESYPISVVINERANEWNLPVRIAGRLSVPDDCVNFYNRNRDSIVASARKFASERRFEIVLVSAGPMSEALIFFMWNANPYNTYVDVGSALDEFAYGQKTRPYMEAGSRYATQVCGI